MAAQHWRLFATGAAVVLLICLAVAWSARARRTALRVCTKFTTATYPVAVAGTKERGYVLTAGGGLFTLSSWTDRNTGIVLPDHPTSMVLSASGKYLLVAGERLTFLDTSLRIKWSRKTTVSSVVEHCLFTSDGKVAAVYSFLSDQSRQYVLYDLAGNYLSGFKVPDFGHGTQAALARNGNLILTVAEGKVYTVSRSGAVIAKFAVPNAGQKLGGLITVVNADGSRILAGYSFAVSGTAESLPRYLFDQKGTKISQFSVPSDSTGLESLGDSFLAYGKKAWFINAAGKVILSTSKLNFNIIDAAVAPGQLALLFQEQTTSQTAVYFLGIYDFMAHALIRQWSTAGSEEPRVFQFPGTRSVLTLDSSLLILCP